MMNIAEHLSHLADDGPLLADAAAKAGRETSIPDTDWSVRELITHVGGVHRWAADVVATGADDLDTTAGSAVGDAPADVGLLGWFREGHAALVDTLRDAPVDLHCATFLPALSPLAFWARRQAHETAIHRADAQTAAGETPSFDADFAQDGIAEMLHGFAARKANAIALGGTIALTATDGPSWLVTLGGERIVAEQGSNDT